MKQMTIPAAAAEALYQAMAADGSVFLIGEDLAMGGVFGAAQGLKDRFGPSRVVDTPISETSFLGLGIGAAMSGMKPVVEIMFCDFLGVCFDQLMNQAAKTRFLSGGTVSLPLVIRTTMGAGDGSGAMHSQSNYGLVASVAGLRVACPSNAADAAGLLKTALEGPDPVVIFEHKGLFGAETPVDPALPPVPFGKARTLRQGADVTLVAIAAMVPVALKVADSLAKRGIGVEVIDPVTINPLDRAAVLASVQKTGRFVVLDEGAAFAGIADALVSMVSREAFRSLKAAPAAITPPHTPVPYAPALEAAWLPDAARVEAAILNMMEDV
ncbi:alpha-ketoacid dehydrogenase subunit beta [Gimibacter soli]|uniref:Transketolase C-terminal domain-containing protein n=1 Tax=Gimibacter soli TaxID=3024400 RepID=A0AAE9XTW0_9PROT|nr:transketolase C-terminal domain-containing protein [Gimibacter soli]WCL54786.1 transketolase C-terminal domain-containing protein [Gimibacter soli]